MTATALQYDANGAPIQALRPGAHVKTAYTAAAGTMAAGTSTDAKIIRVVCTTAAYIKISAAGTGTSATTSDVYMPAGVPEYFAVDGSVKVSAIRDSADGNLHVTEML